VDVVTTLCLHGRRSRERLELSTTHVALLEERWGVEYRLSLPLNQVCSITYYRRTPMLCLWLALLLAAIGGTLLVQAWRTPIAFPAGSWLWTLSAYAGAGAVLCLLIYFLWRGQFLEMASPTDSIEVRLRGQRPDDVRRFVRLLEQQQLRFQQGTVEARQTSWYPARPPDPLPKPEKPTKAEKAAAKAAAAQTEATPSTPIADAKPEDSPSGRPRLDVE
jgi:hypothetical protein